MTDETAVRRINPVSAGLYGAPVTSRLTSACHAP